MLHRALIPAMLFLSIILTGCGEPRETPVVPPVVPPVVKPITPPNPPDTTTQYQEKIKQAEAAEK